MEKEIEKPAADVGPNRPGCNIMSRMALNDNKAGMEGLDKERINQIIYEASKDSKYFENEKKKEDQLEVRIKEQQARISKITKSQLITGEQEAKKIIQLLEEERDLSHTIVHVDMDAFYAAVEMRDDPSLRNKPMAVGGMGMLSTSNYLARRFGVRAAMPGFIGLKLCPNLVIVKPNFDKYQAVSKDIRDVMSQYDPDFCPMSLDEAYLDLTDHLQKRQSSPPLSRMYLLRDVRANSCTNPDSPGNDSSCLCDLNSTLRPKVLCHIELEEHKILCSEAEDVLQEFLGDHKSVYEANVCDVCEKTVPPFTCKIYGCDVNEAVLELRNRIEQRTQLTASAGIAPNMMLAKVCSDRNKPNGHFQIKPDKETVMNFIRDLPIRKISGIGKVTEKLLGSLGVLTCNDFVTHRAMLYHLFSPTSFQHFMRISAGIGSTCVERDGERKSISTERTFTEISHPDHLMEKCQELCQSLSEEMKEERVLGKTFTLKIKTVSFEVKTRSHTLAHFSNDEALLLRAAQTLLQTEIDRIHPSLLRLRLMGVRMSKLCPENECEVSVADMFKKLDKKDQVGPVNEQFNGEQKSKSHRDQFFSHASFDHSDISSLDRNIQQERDESDDDDFRLPLEDTLGLKCTAEHQGMYKASGPSQVKLSPKGKQTTETLTKKESILKFVTGHQVAGHSRYRSDLDSTKSSERETEKSLTPLEKPTTDPFSVHSFNLLNLPPYHLHEEPKSMVLNRCLTGNNAFQQNKGTSDTVITADMKDSFPAKTTNQSCNSDPSVDGESSTFGSLETNMVSCPICRQQKRNWPLAELNTHIDLCLNKQAVKNIISNEKVASVSKGIATSKRPVTSSSQSRTLTVTAKKRKTQPSVISYFKPQSSSSS